MSPISVIITIAAYFVILFTISYIAGRKADNEGFFVGNRKSPFPCCCTRQILPFSPPRGFSEG